MASAVLHAAENKLEHAAEEALHAAEAAAVQAASVARHAAGAADEAAKQALAPVLLQNEEDYLKFNARTTGVPHNHQVCSSDPPAKHAHAPEACPGPPDLSAKASPCAGNSERERAWPPRSDPSRAWFRFA